jgi:hypothetical protein
MINIKDTQFIAMNEKTLSQSACKYLIDYFEDNKEYREVNYNVMKTWQAEVRDELILDMTVEIIKPMIERTTNRKYKPGSAKLIDYVEGSWCKGHRDSLEQSHLSVITMIDISSDLKGGQAYFAKDERAENVWSMMPGPVYSGDTLIYSPNLFHGVYEVQQGRRLVLVTWFLECEK